MFEEAARVVNALWVTHTKRQEVAGERKALHDEEKLLDIPSHRIRAVMNLEKWLYVTEMGSGSGFTSE